MDVRKSLLTYLIFSLYISFVQIYPCVAQTSSKESWPLLAKNEGKAKEDLKGKPDPAIEEYEKEKLAKMKRNIGKRLMFVRTNNPAVFYESPDDLERKLRVKREKEAFVIVEVVQNRLETMNFYRVKFDSGEVGYLSADGYNLEIKIKEGSLLSIPKRATAKKRGLSPSKAYVLEAIELVKSHLITVDSMTGEKRSVEMRMMDQKARNFPNLTWRYEAKEIATYKYRVTQYAGEGFGPQLIRTWIVNLSTNEVMPENLSAKELYH